MPKIEDIPNMTLSEMRPLIQRAIGLKEWPVSDWIVVGMIFDRIGIQVNRAAAPQHILFIVVVEKEIGGGNWVRDRC